MMTADEVIRVLDLAPHPEGGWFRETWRDPGAGCGRGTGTAIYYLLRAGERSRWHRVDATEIWHFYAGEPLELSVAAFDGLTPATRHVLGPDVLDPDLYAGEQRPQHVVEAGDWQAARPLGRWTLVGCTVSPAFDFAGFELAPDGWSPPA